MKMHRRAVRWLPLRAGVTAFSGMAHDLLLFVTWKTFGGLPILDEPWARRLVGLLPELARREEAQLIEVAVVPNHVHVVARSALRVDVPRLAQRMKGASARLLNLDRGTRLPIRWAPGYDARSVSRGDLPRVRTYFDGERTRHRVEWVVRWSDARLDSGLAGRSRPV